MTATHSRRQFLQQSLALGAGAAAFQLLPAAGVLAAPADHPTPRADDPTVLHRWITTVYDVIRQERLTPPNAARIYAYFGVAAYEAVVAGSPHLRSLGRQLNDLPALPTLGDSRRYDRPTAANAAMGRIVPMLFPGNEVARTQFAELEADFHGERAATVGDARAIDRSALHGRQVGDVIVAWIRHDGWQDIQGLAYAPPIGPGLWQSTPPNFGTAIEPHWERVRPFVLDPVDRCAPEPPVPYSTDPTSEFYAQAKATYDTVATNTPWHLETALFWRDNPDGTTGLPSGHWALIALTLIRDLGYELTEAAELMAVHGIAVADGFTSCWTEKYRTNLLRPVTYVRNTFDPNWVTPVNTPQFPEYTSGHSVGSGAAATVLTAMAGTVGFTDNTNPAHPARSYRSVWDAANEAAISRQYGGIHYPMGISAGIDQGVCVAREVLSTVRTRRSRPRAG